MNAQNELIQIQQFLWNHVQNGVQTDQALSAMRVVLGDFAFGLLLPITAALILYCIAALAYQPRLSRGALWIPAFGLFGGVPKLYSHTRPASFLGVFLSSRRKRVKAPKAKKYS